MAQWIDENHILYNDFRDGTYCTVIKNIKSKEERIIKKPVYTLFRKEQADAVFMVCDREVIKGIVDVHDLRDYAVCFLGDRASGSVLTDRLYEF